jgi:hypothetical protein
MYELKIDQPSYEWTVFMSKHFSVTVRAWQREDKFGWNVYANIFDCHPLHNDPEAAMRLDFHGGATYDKYITYEPSQGIKYDFQKAQRVLKVGSDYMHLYDDWAEQCDPKDGIPMRIQNDARSLVDQLLAHQTVVA